MCTCGIRNAIIVTEKEQFPGTVRWNADGRITEVRREKDADREDPRLFDARGAYLVPGGIDPHVHFGGFGDIPIADDFRSGSRAALAGGTTTVMDFCEPYPGESTEACLGRRLHDAEPSSVDYDFHFVLEKHYRKQLRDLDFLFSHGIRNFKLFTVYEGENLQPEEIAGIADLLGRKKDVTFLVHSELERCLLQEGQFSLPETDMRLLALTRPVSCEREAVRALIEIAEKTGAHICVAHTSAGSTAGLPGILSEAGTGHLTGSVSAGSAGGVILETCPHYLTFTEEKLTGADACLYTMTPPLRTETERQKLWKAVLDGKISILSTDHCPYHEADKRGKRWNEVPCGVDGVQTRMLWLLSEGVLKRGLSLSDYVRLTSANAARFYHLYPKKGCIAPGSDADLVLLDPKGTTLVTKGGIAGGADYTIYEGMTLAGRIRAVVKGGNVAFRDGRQTADLSGRGHFLGPEVHGTDTVVY